MTAQALTGRLHSLTIWPLSQGEIGGVREDLLEALKVDPAGTVKQVPTSSTTRAEYVQRVCAGGLPLALRRTPATRARWFDDFVRASVERDALELGRVRERQAMADLLAHLAAQTGQLLNVTKAAQAVGVSRPTVENHLRLLEDLFLLVQLPAWGRTLRSRVNAKPKVHVVDSGLAARLLRLNPDKLAGLDPSALTDFGHLLETFVIGEVRKQASWLNEAVALGHWRTSDGADSPAPFESHLTTRPVQRHEPAVAPLPEVKGDRPLAGPPGAGGSDGGRVAMPSTLLTLLQAPPSIGSQPFCVIARPSARSRSLAVEKSGRSCDQKSDGGTKCVQPAPGTLSTARAIVGWVASSVAPRMPPSDWPA